MGWLISDKTQENNKYTAEYEKISRTGEEDKAWSEYKTNTEKYRSVRDAVIKAINMKKNEYLLNI